MVRSRTCHRYHEEPLDVCTCLSLEFILQVPFLWHVPLYLFLLLTSALRRLHCVVNSVPAHVSLPHFVCLVATPVTEACWSLSGLCLCRPHASKIFIKNVANFYLLCILWLNVQWFCRSPLVSFCRLPCCWPFCWCLQWPLKVNITYGALSLHWY